MVSELLEFVFTVVESSDCSENEQSCFWCDRGRIELVVSGYGLIVCAMGQHDLGIVVALCVCVVYGWNCVCYGAA